MLRQLGSQMEPREQQPPDSTGQRRVALVNSDLVSFSIVADTRRPLKVDLSAPIELVFRHNSDNLAFAGPAPEWAQVAAAGRRAGGAGASSCAYWDTSSR